MNLDGAAQEMFTTTNMIGKHMYKRQEHPLRQAIPLRVCMMPDSKMVNGDYICLNRRGGCKYHT